MKAGDIEWDAQNENHFRENHRASREQVEDVLLSRYYPSRRAFQYVVKGEERYRFEGETRKGRFLVVPAAKRPTGKWRPITCWTLSGKALERYLAWRKTVVTR